MNIKTAMRERLEERKLVANLGEMRAKLEQAEQAYREAIAKRVIIEWIETTYHISLDDIGVFVNEQQYTTEPKYRYYVDLQFGPDRHVACDRYFFNFGDGHTAELEKRQIDDRDNEKLRDLWHAVRDERYVNYNDLIDAAIYVTEADKLDDQTLDEMFALAPKVEA